MAPPKEKAPLAGYRVDRDIFLLNFNHVDIGCGARRRSQALRWADSSNDESE